MLKYVKTWVNNSIFWILMFYSLLLPSQVVATNGDTHLGGEDFDQRVMEHFIKLYKKKTGKRLTLLINDVAAYCSTHSHWDGCTFYRDQLFLKKPVQGRKWHITFFLLAGLPKIFPLQATDRFFFYYSNKISRYCVAGFHPQNHAAASRCVKVEVKCSNVIMHR